MLLISVSPVQVTMLGIEWVFNKDLFSECMTSRIIFSEEQTAQPTNLGSFGDLLLHFSNLGK